MYIENFFELDILISCRKLVQCWCKICCYAIISCKIFSFYEMY
uniref:Uncharacterized protein n=1 Tax=Rhizophora mucronata TaxID=61149 RepID=A0A2P2Q964_RHIMU